MAISFFLKFPLRQNVRGFRVFSSHICNEGDKNHQAWGALNDFYGVSGKV